MRTLTVSPLLTVPAADVNVELLLKEYSPPAVIEIGADVFMPETVIVLDVINVFKGTSDWEVKAKASGVPYT